MLQEQVLAITSAKVDRRAGATVNRDMIDIQYLQGVTDRNQRGIRRAADTDVTLRLDRRQKVEKKLQHLSARRLAKRLGRSTQRRIERVDPRADRIGLPLEHFHHRG